MPKPPIVADELTPDDRERMRLAYIEVDAVIDRLALSPEARAKFWLAGLLVQMQDNHAYHYRLSSPGGESSITATREVPRPNKSRRDH